MLNNTNIDVIRTISGLEKVRACWEAWQRHINSDFDQFELVCGLRTEVEGPYVTVIMENDRLRALIVGRLETSEFSPLIGYFSPVKVPARVVTIIHQGVLGRLAEEGAMCAVAQLWSSLDGGVADAVQFHHLPEHSPLLRALLRNEHRWLCEKKPRWSTHRRMSLPTGEAFIERRFSSKHRAAIRRKERELEAEFPGGVRWSWVTGVDDVASLCAELEKVASLTYQRGLGAGFFDNEEFRQRFSLFARKGQVRVQLLELDGVVRAFWFGFVYSSVFHSSETGYDPNLRKFQVGTQMFIRMCDALSKEGVEKVDFGLGDAPYKQRFGDEEWRETTVWLFAPTAKGLVLRSLQVVFGAIDRTARRIVQETGLLERVKTAWRRRLARFGS